MCHIFFIHSSVDRLLPCLGYCKYAAMNIGVHVSFQIKVFYRYLPRGEIPGSDGNSIFSFLRNLHTVLHSGYTNLHSHNSVGGGPFSPYPLQHLLFVNILLFSGCFVLPMFLHLLLSSFVI